MKITENSTFPGCAALAFSALVLSACGSSPIPDEFVKVTTLLNDKWDAGCLENPRTDPEAPIGYVRETLEFSSLSVTQTFEYFQDANCTLHVTADQVANDDETFFLRKQTQQMSVEHQTGKTLTDLGEAYHLDLQVVAVSIDDVVQSDEQLAQLGIGLNKLLGLFIVTDSDRLHINAAVETRPDTVPLEYFYERSDD